MCTYIYIYIERERERERERETDRQTDRQTDRERESLNYSTGREVSKKSIFPTGFDLSTVFKRILQNDQNLTSVFIYHVI